MVAKLASPARRGTDSLRLLFNDLAELAEVAPGSIVSLEDANGRVPRPLTLRRMARALGVEVAKLFEIPTSRPARR